MTKLRVISVLSVLSFPISLSFLASNHAAMANLIPAIANDNKGMIQRYKPTSPQEFPLWRGAGR